jgi:hypothetical protein
MSTSRPGSLLQCLRHKRFSWIDLVLISILGDIIIRAALGWS